MAELATIDMERRRRVLDEALRVFARYGYRKTSMEAVARAAGVSRQGLYLHYRDKEDLFRATINKMMEDGLAAVERELGRDAPLGERLFGALLAWHGRSAGTPGENAEELLNQSVALLRDSMERHGEAVLRRLTDAIGAAPLAVELQHRGLTPADAAATLDACGIGLKHERLSREDFKARLSVAVRFVVGGSENVR